MTSATADQRGVVSGLLNLSRNLGLITGASAMGAVFALAVGTTDFARASPSAIFAGARLTFLLAGGTMIAALLVALGRKSARSPER